MATVNGHTKTWWKEAIVYQIYPASFCDSNGDGIGDLRGIASRLDHIQSLGVEVFWICPMYDSPQIDMGYDIADYQAVYPPYGTLEDMEDLIAQVHDRGMKIMLDLVVNHTSDQHAWFKESRSSRDNEKADWYIWRPAKGIDPETGERIPPNNWRSYFGSGSAWEWDETRQEFYLHIFAAEMPDLNWESEACRKEIYASAMEFWLRRGVDGFRVDTVNLYSKAPGLPDSRIIDPSSKYQLDPALVCNGPRIHEYIGEMNQVLSRYGAVTVGELPATTSTDKVLEYVRASRKQLSMVFQFDVVQCGYNTVSGGRFDVEPPNYTLPELKDAVRRTQDLIQGTDAWTSVFLENHDQARSVSRFARGADEVPALRVAGAKMLALMQVCLTGTQYVYQGQEIGTVNAPKDTYPLENYIDVNSVLYIKGIRDRYVNDPAGLEKALDKAFIGLQYLARDHPRIPVAWDGELPYGGFSLPSSDSHPDEPWMRPHPLAGEINVSSQFDDPDSVLSFWMKAIEFRKENVDALIYGDFKLLREGDLALMEFTKTVWEPERAVLYVVLNFTAEERPLPDTPTPTEFGVGDANATLTLMMGTHGERDERLLLPFEGRVYRVDV